MSSNHEDVGEFHRKFDLRQTNDGDYGPAPQDRALLGFRLNFLLEELTELMEAVGAEFETDHDGDIRIFMTDDSDLIDDAQAFDALLDLTYVAMGTAHLLGYPWQIGWNAVQNANMAKQRAASADDSKRGSSFDVIKPPGWYPPNIQGILDQHGWRLPPVACPICGDSFLDGDTTCEPGVCRKGSDG